MNKYLHYALKSIGQKVDFETDLHILTIFSAFKI